MLSDDFAFVWEKERKWEDWYYEEIVNREMYKTLLISYEGRYYQYEPIGYKAGEMFNGKKVVEDSYLFLSFDDRENGHSDAFFKATCYDSFKQAVDEAEIVPGKTLKDIWYDPDGEYIDFM